MPASLNHYKNEMQDIREGLLPSSGRSIEMEEFYRTAKYLLMSILHEIEKSFSVCNSFSLPENIHIFKLPQSVKPKTSQRDHFH